MTPAFVYVLGSGTPDRWITYVGWTDDIARRLAMHNSGKGARSTRGRIWILLYAEKHATKNAAMSREWHLKRDRTFRKHLVLNGALDVGHKKGRARKPATSRRSPGRRTARYSD